MSPALVDTDDGNVWIQSLQTLEFMTTQPRKPHHQGLYLHEHATISCTLDAVTKDLMMGGDTVALRVR